MRRYGPQLLAYLMVLGVFAYGQHQQNGTIDREHAARLVTVNQRCEFTSLVLGVIERKDLADAQPFRESYAGCVRQLDKLKKGN